MTSWRGKPLPKPDTVFDVGLQHERTTLAWERTSISLVVAGTIVARWAAEDGLYVHAAVGALMAFTGVGVLVWSGHNYANLHEPLEAGETPVHPYITRVVGWATTIGSFAALTLGIILVIRREFG